MNTHTNTNAHRFYIVPTKRDKRHTLYSVLFNGRVVILGTHLPTAHGCRYLASMGLSGRAEMWDFSRSYARMVFPDLVKAAGMTIEDDDHGRPRVKPVRKLWQDHIHEGSDAGMDNHPSNHKRLSTVA
ncbi:hypothetical protein IB238_01685 [Rhizobium sp. ARZ01]|uniref:hypothetical protein n=1 Tax=Rhizobium sp. ARZ01 TaxID=2769313 RepID=UPI00177BD46C|nr:hypothetical protein [Rhizobium sp. ARZ01]MBD9371350.1 hypothetical protein [Rhizobium sp. ARZ01]